MASLASLVAAALVGQVPSNLDFSKGLDGWEGSGFRVVQVDSARPTWVAASSADRDGQRKGMIRQVFEIPPRAQTLTFRAMIGLDTGEADGRLDVVLAGEDNKVVPRKVKSATGWSASTRISFELSGQPRDYAWDVAGYVGKRMQIVLIDGDDRPGNCVVAGSFALRIEPETQDLDFARHMLDLQKKHNLAPMARFDSRRFSAIGNVRDDFAVDRLKNCEIFFDQFLDHFRSRGFEVQRPSKRLMLALFDSPEGFEAYMGQRMPPGIAGVYHPQSNRLVLYDLAENRVLAAKRKDSKKAGIGIGSSLDRARFVDTVERQLRDISKDANLSTTMHECAHQIAFNCGLMNRDGDVACWLAEGLATYCEATDQGDWTVLGTPNPMRVGDLIRSRGDFVPLKDLIVSDRWRETNRILVGYAQSWALFRMLMEERPTELKSYMKAVFSRRGPELRLEDFRRAFGDVAAVEQRHRDYVKEMIAKHAPAGPR